MRKINYYLLISSLGIGGAEMRALKLANYINNHFDINLIFAINLKLYQEYKKNNFTRFLLDSLESNITIVDSKRIKLFRDDKLHFILKDKRSYKLVNKLHVFILKKISWYYFLKNTLNYSENNRVHCIYGETARIGSLLHNSETRIITNIEITSNRHVKEWSHQIIRCLKNETLENNCFINCVSKTVYENFTKAISSQGFDSLKKITDYYHGPFLFFPKMYNDDCKKNIIVFAHRLISPKNPVLFAEVIKNLFELGSLNNWKVLIRGNGKEESKVIETLQHEIDSGLVEVGYTNDLQYDLARSKIFVSIIETGNFPSNSLFEAMNYRNILVLSNTGITKQKFNFKEVLYCDLNQKSLRESLQKSIDIANNPDLLETYGNSSLQNYNLLVSKKQYLSQLENIMKLETR